MVLCSARRRAISSRRTRARAADRAREVAPRCQGFTEEAARRCCLAAAIDSVEPAYSYVQSGPGRPRGPPARRAHSRRPIAGLRRASRSRAASSATSRASSSGDAASRRRPLRARRAAGSTSTSTPRATDSSSRSGATTCDGADVLERAKRFVTPRAPESALGGVRAQFLARLRPDRNLNAGRAPSLRRLDSRSCWAAYLAVSWHLPCIGAPASETVMIASPNGFTVALVASLLAPAIAHAQTEPLPPPAPAAPAPRRAPARRRRPPAHRCSSPPPPATLARRRRPRCPRSRGPEEEKPTEPFAFGDFTWLNGANRAAQGRARHAVLHAGVPRSTSTTRRRRTTRSTTPSSARRRSRATTRSRSRSSASAATSTTSTRAGA